MEPIPTEEMATVSSAPSEKGEPKPQESPQMSGDATQLQRAYPWLLGASMCLSATLCWMYVSKPVVVAAAEAEPTPEVPAVDASPTIVPDEPIAEVKVSPKEPELLPSADVLPGETLAAESKDQSKNQPIVAAPAQEALPKPAMTLISQWEKTNLKVQHILSAEMAGGAQEKIELNVPVRYHSRTLRWTPADAKKARNVLGRLMIYERNLSALKMEGRVILKEWNDLLARTVPASALRADSMSLPYNHGHGAPPRSVPTEAPVIQVDQ